MEFFEKHKKLILILISGICLISAVLTLVFKNNASFAESSLGFIVTPFQKYIGGAGKWIDRRIGAFTNMNDLYTENIGLKEQIATLEADNKRLALYEKENKRLSELLEVDQKYPDFPKVGAEVIALDVSNSFNTFIIDKGTKHGLENDMVVMAPGGLVGKIYETAYSYSKVISIIDDKSSVSAKSVRTEDIGIIKGDYTLLNNGYCRMDYIDNEAEIIEGDEIITSHLSDVFPPGIAIGVVKEVRTDSNGLTKYALIKPHVNFKDLTNVLVINERYKNLLLEE